MSSAGSTPPRTRLAAKLIKAPENVCRGDCKMATPQQIQDLLSTATENIKQSMVSIIEKSPPPETVTFASQNIEYYTGREDQDVEKWFKKFENRLKSRRCAPSAQAAVAELACFLKGPAETFFNHLTEQETKDLNTVKQAFLNRFASENLKVIWRQQLRSCKQNQGDSLDDYVEKINDLCQKLKVSDDEKMYAFISGLPLDVQEHVLMRSPKSFPEAEEYARLKLSIATAIRSDRNQLDLSQKTLVNIVTKLLSLQNPEEQDPAKQIAAVDTPIISEENTLREFIRTAVRAEINLMSEFDDSLSPDEQFVSPRISIQSDEGEICEFCGHVDNTTHFCFEQPSLEEFDDFCENPNSNYENGHAQ